MKTIKYIISVLFIIMLFVPKVHAEEMVKIKSIELEDISINTIEKTNPTFNNLDINVDLEFRDINNYAKYKIIIENNTNKDYFIENETYFTNSNYIKYNYHTENKIKANDTSIVYLTISYDNQIEETLYTEGKYIEKNNSTIKLLNEDGQAAVNPNTGTGLTIINIILFSLLSLAVITILNKTKFQTFSIVFLSMLSLPLIIQASEELKLNLNVNVEIAKSYSVDYAIEYNNVLIKYDELDKYDLTRSSCLDLYIGIIDEDTKYKYCHKSILYKGEKKYRPNEIVEINQLFTIKRTKYIDLEDYCIEEEQGLLCKGIYVYTKYVHSNISYVKETNEYYNYVYNQDEIESFEFNCKSYKCYYFEDEIYLNLPLTFKMPNYDVLITSIEPI